MKNKNRIVSLALVVATILSLFAGFGGYNVASAATTQTQIKTVYSTDDSKHASCVFTVPAGATNVSAKTDNGGVSSVTNSGNNQYLVILSGGTKRRVKASSTKEVSTERKNTATVSYGPFGEFRGATYSWDNHNDHRTLDYDIYPFAGTLTKWDAPHTTPKKTYNDYGYTITTTYTGKYHGTVTEYDYPYVVTLTYTAPTAPAATISVNPKMVSMSTTSDSKEVTVSMTGTYTGYRANSNKTSVATVVKTGNTLAIFPQGAGSATISVELLNGSTVLATTSISVIVIAAGSSTTPPPTVPPTVAPPVTPPTQAPKPTLHQPVITAGDKTVGSELTISTTCVKPCYSIYVTITKENSDILLYDKIFKGATLTGSGSSSAAVVKFIPKEAGKYIVKAYAANYAENDARHNTAEAEASFTINAPVVVPTNNNVLVSSITPKDTLIILSIDEQYELIATPLPSNATNKNIEWTIDDSDKATITKVNGKYYIKGVSGGFTKINAVATDGSGIISKNVTVQVADIMVNKNKEITFTGKNETKNYTYKPYETGRYTIELMPNDEDAYYSSLPSIKYGNKSVSLEYDNEGKIISAQLDLSLTRHDPIEFTLSANNCAGTFTLQIRRQRAIISTGVYDDLNSLTGNLDTTKMKDFFENAIQSAGFITDSRTNFSASSLLNEKDEVGNYLISSDIIMFSGHGFNDCIQFPTHISDYLDKDDIPDLPHTRLVLLLACLTAENAEKSILHRFHEKGAKVCIGWTIEIHSNTADAFAKVFFEYLSDGFSVDYAVKQGVQAALSLLHGERLKKYVIYGDANYIPFIT